MHVSSQVIRSSGAKCSMYDTVWDTPVPSLRVDEHRSRSSTFGEVCSACCGCTCAACVPHCECGLTGWDEGLLVSDLINLNKARWWKTATLLLFRSSASNCTLQSAFLSRAFIVHAACSSVSLLWETFRPATVLTKMDALKQIPPSVCSVRAAC